MEYIQIQGPDGQMYEFPADMPESEIAAVMAQQFPPDYEPPPKPGMMDTLGGLGEQVVAGINRGAVGMVALPKTLVDLGALGLEKTRMIEPDTAKGVYETLPGLNYENLLKAWEGFAGELPKPDTRAERYVSTAAEFVPGFARKATLAAPGLINKGIHALQDVGRSATAGIVSEAGGQAAEGLGFDNTWIEGLARILGGVTGASIGGSGGRLTTKTPEQKAASEVTLSPSELIKQRKAEYDAVMSKPADPQLLTKAAIDSMDEVTRFGPGPAAYQTKQIMDKAKKMVKQGVPPPKEELDNIRHNLGKIVNDHNADSLQQEMARRVMEKLDNVIGTGPDVQKARELGQRYILEKDIQDIGRKAQYDSDPAGFISKEAQKKLRDDPNMPEALTNSLDRLRKSGEEWSPYMSHSLYAMIMNPSLAAGSFLLEKLAKGQKKRVTNKMLQESLDIARAGSKTSTRDLRRRTKKYTRVFGQVPAAITSQGVFMEDADGNKYDVNGNLIK
jgi:hypothetical protein